MLHNGEVRKCELVPGNEFLFCRCRIDNKFAEFARLRDISLSLFASTRNFDNSEFLEVDLEDVTSDLDRLEAGATGSHIRVLTSHDTVVFFEELDPKYGLVTR